MPKIRKQRILSIILAISLVLGIFIAGCKKEDGDTSGLDVDQQDKDEDKKDEGKDDEEENEDETGFAGYPMDDEDITISWWVGETFTLHDSFETAEESPLHSGLAKHTGVDIDWQFPSAGMNADEAFNFILASGTLPDIIFRYDRGGLKQNIERYMGEDVVRDLTDYIEEYSPAYYKFLQSNEAYDKSLKTDDGKYYGYGFFREDGGWNDTFQGPVIRKDWLDRLNREMPETVSDWDDTIRAFNTEFDAMFSFAWGRFKSTGISGAFGAYGAADYQLFVDDNNKIQLAQAQPEWKDYMAKLNDWWESGLLDQEVMSMSEGDARTKALNEEMGISFTAMSQITSWIKDAEEEETGAEWIGLQYPTADDGALPMVFGGYGFRDDIAVVTTGCSDEKLETAMRLLDYAYTDEGQLYWNFGTKGESWDYDASGEPIFTDLVEKDPDGPGNAVRKFSGAAQAGPCIQLTRFLHLRNDKVAIEANDTWFYPNEDVTAKWKLPPGITPTVEESNKLNDLTEPIAEYVSDMAIKFINGEESLDNFDNFLDQLDKMRLPEVLQIQQEAYDRYLAR